MPSSIAYTIASDIDDGKDIIHELWIYPCIEHVIFMHPSWINISYPKIEYTWACNL
jgi:hypothetical protein